MYWTTCFVTGSRNSQKGYRLIIGELYTDAKKGGMCALASGSVEEPSGPAGAVMRVKDLVGEYLPRDTRTRSS